MSIVHLAARAGVRPSIQAPALYAAVNVLGTTVVLDAARAAQHSPRVIVASSSSRVWQRQPGPILRIRCRDPACQPVCRHQARRGIVVRDVRRLCDRGCASCRSGSSRCMARGSVPTSRSTSSRRSSRAGAPIPCLRRRIVVARLHVRHGHRAGRARRHRSDARPRGRGTSLTTSANRQTTSLSQLIALIEQAVGMRGEARAAAAAAGRCALHVCRYFACARGARLCADGADARRHSSLRRLVSRDRGAAALPALR